MAKTKKAVAPPVAAQVQGFVDFIREQGVVGLAIGVVIGVAVKDTVDALVAGIINPLIGILLPNADTLAEKTVTLFGAEFLWGGVLLNLINLMIIAAIIYFVVRGLKFDQVDKKK